MADLAERVANLSVAQRNLLEQRLKGSPRTAEPIAIVGMACRFPGASSLDAFWRIISEGIDATGEIPPSRWDVDEFYDTGDDQPGKMSVRWAGMIADVDRFDPQFFGISPREASRMDPQQRLLLEVAWESLETSCISPERLCGSRTGVFIGIGGTDYSKIPSQFEDYYRHIDAHVGTGNALSIAANRLSYVLDVRGPSLAVDTACSSGLIGVHLAVSSLRNRECDAALAGAVNLILTPETTIAFSKARMLSPDGRCRPFDASANGYVRGEGCGILVLKRLTDAVRDGDRVLAVIRATAANQDGRTSGITAPSSRAQQEVIRAALAQAGIASESVGYIEAHGTGTPLGDPIEAQALAEVFRRLSADQPPCSIASVKANIGHTETVSGIAGIIKVVLMLQHRVIPPQLYFSQLNEHISLAGTRLRIAQDSVPWDAVNGTRVAGVSSFGFGGTNAHVIVEEASPQTGGPPPAANRPLHLLTLSAKTETALARLAGRYDECLSNRPELAIEDICASANAGRSHFSYRAACVASDTASLSEQLAALRDGRKIPGMNTARARMAAPPKVAFLFTGQGSQYVGMGRALWESEPVFREAMNRCDEGLRGELEQSLLDVLFERGDTRGLLDETAYTQPALFSLEYSLAQLWRSWGVEPCILLGHSVGEYVAACIADVFDLPQALRMIAARARLMQQLPRNGSMAVVFAPAERVRPRLSASAISIAAVNGPENTVISGDSKAVEVIAAQFAAEGIAAQLLTVSHAFHSPLMEPMLDEFERIAAQGEFRAPAIPIASNLTGRLLTGDAPDARYWRDHARNPVLFEQGIRALADQDVRVLVEVGPTASLIGMGKRCWNDANILWLPSLRKGQDDWSVLLQSVAELYLTGGKIDWAAFERTHGRRTAELPTYPFDHDRYWFEPNQAQRRFTTGGHGPALHPLLGHRIFSPLPTQIFESRLSCHSPKYLAEHQVQGAPVFPAAGYVEMALAAAKHLLGPGEHVIENLSIQHAMFLAEGHDRAVQLTASPAGADEFLLEVHSTAAESDTAEMRWTLHACCKVRLDRTGEAAPSAPPELDEIRRQVHSITSQDAFYHELMRQRGLVYGPSFQVLQDLRRDDQHALTAVAVPPGIVADLDKYELHPAIGDALFQATAGLVPLEPDGSFSRYTYLPTQVQRVRVKSRPQNGSLILGVRTSKADQASPETVEGDICVFDTTGQMIVEMTGVRVQRVGRSGGDGHERSVADWLYRTEWKTQPLSISGEIRSELAAPRETALILADDSGVGGGLAESLRQSGRRIWLVRCASEFRLRAATDGSGGECGLNPLDDAHWERLFSEGFSSAESLPASVIHLWSLDIDDPGHDGSPVLREARRRGTGAALLLVRRLARVQFSVPPAVFLVTRGSQVASSQDSDVACAQAPLWGLGRVLGMEHPEFHCRLIDLDPRADIATAASQLTREIIVGSAAEQIAYRHGERLVARLEPAPESQGPAETTGVFAVPRSTSYHLRLGQPGRFESLRFEPFERPTPGAGQVEVEVAAAGLNFSDVLKAMGLYPGLTDPIVPLGIECAGRVTAVGPDIERLRPGDEVLGVAPFSFASHALTAEYALVRRPDTLNDPAEAATVPITFLTAYYALITLARLQQGERILIHAGAGGVGLAAIQIAQHVGAEVFATAGSESKRDYLRSLGVQQVFSSRTLEFAGQIRAATEGQGVDVVLNSLPGDAISKSLSVLRAYGRFLEIGKTDIYQNRMIGLLPFQDNLSYFAIDLDRMLRQRPDAIRSLFAEVMRHFAEGVYHPLPKTEFSIDRTVEAFRFMAQRRNIGKVVVSLGRRDGVSGKTESAGSRLIRSDATYLVTGGLGALGRHLAQWLIDNRAGHIVLVSRNKPAGEAAEAIENWRASGVNITAIAADVADWDSLKTAMDTIRSELPPLRGVFHAAGVLDDGLLFDMDLASLDRAMSPKVIGAWNLHAATATSPLEHFVLFSSVAAVIGSPGQANYAAGNAFLDALAEYRRFRGLPALSVNWGPWSGSGMAVDAGHSGQMQSRGMRLLGPGQALRLLEQLMSGPDSNCAAMDVNWPDLLRMLGNRVPTLLHDIAVLHSDEDQTVAAEGIDRVFLDSLQPLDAGGRVERLRDYFATELARIMGIDKDSLELDQPLNEIGMDSLLAMELKNNLERRLDFSLPMTAFMEGPSITKLASHASKAISTGGAEAADSIALPESDLRTWSPIVRMSPLEGAAPLFCIHPLGGDINCYRHLARALTRNPLIAMRGRGNEGVLPPHSDLGEMIEVYHDAVKSIQPSGPYFIGGWSAGGIFAYELARTLQERGDELGLVILFDTPLPSIYDSVHLDDNLKFLLELGNFTNWFAGATIDVRQISYEHLSSMDEATLWQFVWEVATSQRVLPRETTPDHIRRIVEAGNAHARMIRGYRIAPFSQKIHLVRPETGDVLEQITGRPLGHDFGWAQTIGDRLQIHSAPGDHFSMMSPEHAGALARVVEACTAGLGRSPFSSFPEGDGQP
jgi:myxalamid-type polyketide synthase MxaB